MTLMDKERSNAQKSAERKYGEKRKSQPRLPGGYLSEEQDKLLNKVAAHYSSKKEAIFEGLKLLDKKLSKDKQNK